MNILHLVQDEKFIDFFASTMETATGVRHLFLVHTEESTAPLKCIKEVVPFRRVSNSYFGTPLMLQDLEIADVLVVHFLTKQAATMIQAARKETRVVWSGWGGDYYYLVGKGERSFLGAETHAITKSLEAPILGQFKRLLEPFKSIYRNRTRIIPVLKRVDFFSSPLPNEFVLLKERFGKDFQAEYVQLNYGSVAASFAVGASDNAGNVLIGNSATPSNNHAEAFRIVRNLDLDGRKVIVPLSYGDKRYRDAILSLGHKILGDRFEPIVDFRPLAEYNALISSCTMAIMNHYRQQALGNIGAMLYQGRKVYLSSNSAAYRFLRDKGAEIFCIEELTNPRLQPFEPLSISAVARNREVVEDFWGAEKIAANAQHFIQTVSR